jgi:glucosamine--fructose-6-phosphate aminotransferase (isomerizing)
MNPQDSRYSRFALCREMLDTVELARTFDASRVDPLCESIRQAGRLLLTGEGSSRIFPAKNAIRKARRWGLELEVITEGSRQASEYELGDYAVFAASNSGRTKEVVALMRRLAEAGHPRRFSLTANTDTVLESHAVEGLVLSCGWEQAVAATKSVAEQAMVYQAIASQLAGRDFGADSAGLADKLLAALTAEVPREFVEAAAGAGTIYFAGYNDGVAEELTLKTNEITRRKSDFLEGTYAVHGIEEVMDASDVLFLVEPMAEEIGKFREVLVEGVGMRVVAIATAPTELPTIVVPDAGELTPFVYLAAGWNLLVEIGLHLEIDLDKPQRARKVGNEFQG